MLNSGRQMSGYGKVLVMLLSPLKFLFSLRPQPQHLLPQSTLLKQNHLLSLHNPEPSRPDQLDPSHSCPNVPLLLLHPKLHPKSQLQSLGLLLLNPHQPFLPPP
jgi:hypothetical protein